MASELLASLSIFKSLLDMTKGLKDMNDAAVRNAAVIELQEKILAAHTAQAALVEHVSELEETVAHLEAWDTDKQRYELTEFATSQFAYALKEEARGGEPTHMLCANCYNQNQKSVLQTETRNPGRHQVSFCQHCDNELFSPDSGGRGEEHRRQVAHFSVSGSRARKGR